MPERVQRKRTAGWRAPEGAVYVGRGTRFGNPWRVVRAGDHWTVAWSGVARYEPPNGAYSVRCAFEVTARQEAVHYYRQHLEAHPDLVETARRMLAGRDLMCWCPLPEPGEPDHCHAAVLIVLANEKEPARA